MILTQEIEIEYKNLLTNDEFEALLIAFSIKREQFITQVNHYFDTENFSLRDQGCALRIRSKKGQYTLTLKQPHTEGLLETHQTITEEAAEKIINGDKLIHGQVYDIIKNLGINPEDIVYLGTLSTDRAETIHKNNTLVFDHSYYLGRNDFELEYEVIDAKIGKIAFHELLEYHNIPLRSTDNKIRRFFKAKIEKS